MMSLIASDFASFFRCLVVIQNIALTFHVPFNILLSKLMGIEGVALAISPTDLSAGIMLVFYVLAAKKGVEDGWWEQRWTDWIQLLSHSAQCCFTARLKWWCYKILILLAGQMCNPQRTVAVLTVVLNFEYYLYGVMASLATCAST